MLPEKDQWLLPHSSSWYRLGRRSCRGAGQPTPRKLSCRLFARPAPESDPLLRNDLFLSSVRRLTPGGYSTCATVFLWSMAIAQRSVDLFDTQYLLLWRRP